PLRLTIATKVRVLDVCLHHHLTERRALCSAWKAETAVNARLKMLRNILHRIAGLYFGWRMIAVSCTIRVLGGGLHAYGLSVFFLPITQELALSRTAASLVFS